jgi:hypothetical protein
MGFFVHSKREFRFLQCRQIFKTQTKNPFYRRIFKQRQRIAAKKAGFLFIKLSNLQGIFELVGFVLKKSLIPTGFKNLAGKWVSQQLFKN